MDSNIVTVRRLQRFWGGCKKYVDDGFFTIPISSAITTTVTWEDIYSAHNRGAVVMARIDYVDNGATIPVVVPLYSFIGNQSAGTIMFTFVMGVLAITYLVSGAGANVCTVIKQEKGLEITSNKVQSVVSNSTDTVKYPSTKAVFDEFQRKPVTVWEVDGTTVTEGLKALQTDIAETMNWQLTGLDLTPFKRIKVYSKGGQGSTNAGTTGAMILEMSLDPRMAIETKGGHYVGSVLVQKPNDSNRYASLTCAVSADKTSFAVLRQTSLYGTAATTNNNIGADVVLIEGYYD